MPNTVQLLFFKISLVYPPSPKVASIYTRSFLIFKDSIASFINTGSCVNEIHYLFVLLLLFKYSLALLS